jgi:Domain of unknown function (DUF4337)
MEIAKELKADLPATTWGKILGATPIVMTVIATVLAGLASSEMTRAQYDRSLAAELQSKASDQWNLFQAKKLESVVQNDVLDLMESTQNLQPVDAAALDRAANDGTGSAPELARLREILADPAARQALDLFQRGVLPAKAQGGGYPPKIAAVVAAVQGGREEAEIDGLLADIPSPDIAEAMRAANARSQALDAVLAPVNQTISGAEGPVKGLLRRLRADSAAETGLVQRTAALSRDFAAQRLRYTGLRYLAEARLNQDIANLFELQLRKANIAADRHHGRSQHFFLGMLAAQMGVVVATFSLAARKRNLLWGIAAAAGLSAAIFAAYVYLFT